MELQKNYLFLSLQYIQLQDNILKIFTKTNIAKKEIEKHENKDYIKKALIELDFSINDIIII